MMVEAVNNSLLNYAEGSATYQISVKGKLDTSWSDRLAGMDITHYETDENVISTLTGRIIDQSELIGVLNALNNYHYKVLHVNQLNK